MDKNSKNNLGSKSHAFNIDDAVKYGVEPAVMLSNFRHWLDYNLANKTHLYENRVWTFNSTKSLSKLFPYYSTHQINRILKKLEKEGILITGNFNKNPFDQTRWYSINDVAYSLNAFSEIANCTFSENAKSIKESDITTNKNNNVNFFKECASESIFIENFIYEFNKLSDIPKVEKVTEKRKKQILKLLSTHGEQKILSALSNIAESDFLRGKINNWKLSLDWLLKDANFIKVTEGNYSNSQNRGAANNFGKSKQEKNIEAQKGILETVLS